MEIIIYRLWPKSNILLWYWKSDRVTRNRSPILSLSWQTDEGICDPLFVMIEQCKWKEYQVNPFIPSL